MLKKVILIICFLFNINVHAEGIILKVFHAGSLSVPFSRIEKVFEKKYPWIDVRREASGSVMAVRKVIDLHKRCDVIVVADYFLIPEMMFPEYADHVKIFARNEIVLCYTRKSKYSQIINRDNWYKILLKDDVKFGFSDPNLDPCGYRAIMCFLLFDLYYKKPIFEALLERYLPIKIIKKDLSVIAKVSAPFNPKGRKIYIRPKEVDLLALLESAQIDYAMNYLSVAKQHHLNFIRLPSEINLGALSHKNCYSKVKISLGKRTIEGKPIFYGIASLKRSFHPKEAKLFEEFVTGKTGADILISSYQIPVYPAKEIRADE